MKVGSDNVSETLSGYLQICELNQETPSNNTKSKEKTTNAAEQTFRQPVNPQLKLSNRAFVDLSKKYTGNLKDDAEHAPDELAKAIYKKLNEIEAKKQSLLELIINITINFFLGYGFNSDKNLASEAKSSFWFNQNFSYNDKTRFYELSNYGKRNLNEQELKDFLDNCDEKTRLIVQNLSIEGSPFSIVNLGPEYFKKCLPNLKKLIIRNKQLHSFNSNT
jgi:hypothetical protein